MSQEFSATDDFKRRVKELIDQQAAKSELIAETLKKPNKNLDDCVSYIIERVYKEKVNAYTTGEITAMALHYYREDDIKVSSSAKVKRIIIPKPSLEEKLQSPESAVKRYSIRNKS